MKADDMIHGFRIKYSQELPEIAAVLWRMEYEKNGAELIWLERADENKTFAIAFKTIPTDDTGVFHILEHSVLCGSQKYPVKEPFVELIKGSMATFLNAFTFPDKTMYPVSSRNMQDFLNLMDVYMDAVLHPLSILNNHAFRQEGWHYELENASDSLKCNGVVYNEMKGAYASYERVMMTELNRMLFPDNCYGFESGGHPEHIPELTYENYLASHKRYYHPSNSRIVLDGEMDLDTVLSRLDSFLCEYDRLEPDAEIPMQKPVASDEKTVYYEIGAGENAQNRAILSEGWVFGDYRDLEKSIAFSVLSEVLAASNESPLPKALLEKGLAEDVQLSKMDGIQQIYAYLVIRNVAPDKKDEIRAEVKRVLTELASNGLNHTHLHSVLSRMEFSIREKEFGGMPRGLIYAMAMLESWLYGGDPAQNLCYDELFTSLRQKIDDGWFENLLREILIENPHRAKLCLLPSTTLGEEKQMAEEWRLAEIKKQLSFEELSDIIDKFAQFRKIQDMPNSKEETASLPKLSVQDIPKGTKKVSQLITDIDGVTLLHQPLDTNGIIYLNMYFSLADLSHEELSKVTFMSSLIGESATQDHSAIEMQNTLHEKFGRFSAQTDVCTECGQIAKANPYMIVKIALLKQNKQSAAEIMDEVLNHSDFSDTDFVCNILRQMKMALEQSIAMNGNYYASIRAASGNSAYGAVREVIHGITHFRYLQKINNEYNRISADFCESLGDLTKRIFIKNRLTLSVTGECDKDWLKSIISVLREGTIGQSAGFSLKPVANEGFTIPTEIGFAAKSANLYKFNSKYSGTAKVAAQLMTYDYLWNEVRVKGGAYGTGMKVDSTGSVAFTSYRDPNPVNSIQCFDRVGAALREFCDNENDLEKYIISTIATVEPLLTPRAEGEQAEDLYFSGRSYDSVQKERTEILNTTLSDLYEFSRTVDRLLDSSVVCIIGGSDMIDNCKDIVDKIEAVS